MNRKSSGRSLLLLEICLLFIFFVISIVICVSIFISASNKNHQANDLNSAAVKAVTIADTIKACGGDIEQTKNRLDADSDFNIYYNSEWDSVGKPAYKVSISYKIDDGLLKAVIYFRRIDESDPFYSLEVKEFLGEGIR